MQVPHKIFTLVDFCALHLASIIINYPTLVINEFVLMNKLSPSIQCFCLAAHHRLMCGWLRNFLVP